MDQQENPLLNNFDLPLFNRIQPEHVVPAVTNMVKTVRSKLEELESNAKPSWDAIGKPLEEISRTIKAVWGPVVHLTGVKNSEELRKAYAEVQGDVIQLGLRISQSKPIFTNLKDIKDSDQWAQLNSAKKRIIEHSIRAARLTGIELPEDQRKEFNDISQKLSKLATDFSNHVLDSTKKFSLEITDKNSLKGMPVSFLNLSSQSWNRRNPDAPKEATAHEGPWLVTLDFPSFMPFLQHCPDRALREEVYRAYITKASFGELDNGPLIEEILNLRQQKAELLGFNTFAELSLSQKMARTVDAAEQLLNDLLDSTKGRAAEEQDELKAYAKQNGLETDLMPWDTFYFAEKQREARFAYSEDELRPYFPFPQVLQGLFDLVEKLFSIRVEEATSDAQVWNEDVRYFKIFDTNNKHIAAFFLDPYSRPENKREGAWMDECIVRGFHKGELLNPVAYLVCNSTPPVGQTPSLMTFREVETLFHEFGHGLQHMLTQVQESGASGINGIEWDAVELPSQFMENWCYHEETLMGLTKHIETNEQLPKDLFQKIKKAKTYRSGYAMLRQLHFGLIDLELHHRHTGKESPFETNRKIAERVLVQPLLESDRFLCSFAHIFAGGYAAGYYSYKWAEVLSADAFSAFEDAGLDKPDKVQEIGKKFRDTVLALGGSEKPEEVFQKFRGRAPTVDALLRHNELQKGP